MAIDQSMLRTLPDFMVFLEEGGSEQSSSNLYVEHLLTVKEVMNKLTLAAELISLWNDPKILAFMAPLLFLLMTIVLRCLLFPSRAASNRTLHRVRSRSRSSFIDQQQALIPPARERLPTDDSHSRLLPKEGKPSDGVVICGYKTTSIRFEAWTPPTPWTDASKQLLPTNIQVKSRVTKVYVELNLARGLLYLDEGKASFDLQQVQLHVQKSTGAVIELFVGGTKLEHTFLSAQSAAQFQNDLLAYQIVGKFITNMYTSLELVHRGSKAHEGKESVFHDTVGDSEMIPAAIAWDDVFRCLGGAFLDIRETLEQLYQNNDKEEELVSLSPQYLSRRTMLGHVDFFRLFCPPLPPGSVPQVESSPLRLKTFVDLRKKVAHASQYIQAYVRARCVVNKGWPVEVGRDAEFRLAYDDDAENIKHDAIAKNEYYEGIISRNVVCESISNKRRRKYSDNQKAKSIQAYALVGCHTFRLPSAEVNHPLAHDKDLIEGIPSLRKIVKSNPDLDFFCAAFFAERRRIAIVSLFVRTLPKRVDLYIDRLTDRSDTSEVKLAIFLQMHPGGGLSPLAATGIKFVSKLYSWVGRADQIVPVECGAERIQMSGTYMDSFMEVHHFRGSPPSSANYIATTARLKSKSIGTMLFRRLCHLLEGMMPAITIDLSYVLVVQREGELQERPLATIRMVHYDPEEIAHPIELSINEVEDEKPTAASQTGLANYEQGQPNNLSNHSAMVIVKPCVNSVCQKMEADIDDLIDILDGVRIPVHRASLHGHQMDLAADFLPTKTTILPPHAHREHFVSLPVLEMLDRFDLQRYYVASGNDIRAAAMRVVESTTWRGFTFPIDTRPCRIELQSGQFFQQGVDLKGNPIFYFRNMCAGPWRKDCDAVIQAVLHRLETSLQSLSKEKPWVKVTLVVLLGRPIFWKAKKGGNVKELKNDDQTKTTAETTDATDEQDNFNNDEEADGVEIFGNEETTWNPFRMGVNPRLQPDQDYHVHTNLLLIKKLLVILLEHYPERLDKALLVPGKSRNFGHWHTALGVQHAIRHAISPKRTRHKCIVLRRAYELVEYVHRSEIVTVAGGEAPLQEGVFECF